MNASNWVLSPISARATTPIEMNSASIVNSGCRGGLLAAVA
jgi:hypothetical protein